MSRRGLFAVAVAACIGCCIGPILGILGGVAALGFLSTVWIGVAGLVIAGLAMAALTVVRRRRACTTPLEEVPVELTLDGLSVSESGRPAPSR